eukprot:146190_1
MSESPRTIKHGRVMSRLRRIKSRFHSHYSTGESIGSGTFACVKYCQRKSDDRLFAVKIVSKHHLTDKELRGLQFEIRILKSLRFPHIIRMEEVYDDGTKVRMVLELCEGGDLFDKLLAAPDKHFTEVQCAQILCIVARSLKYLHSHFIVHRDLKPENILFTTDGILKITDFGLAHYLKLPPSLHVMHTCCGTPHYVAPEIIRGHEYSYKVDYWSLGVILYIMLSGMQPFQAPSLAVMYGMIIRGQYGFQEQNWDGISQEAKDLVRKLICVDPETRYEAHDVMKHAFVTNNVDLDALRRNEKRLIELHRNVKKARANKTNKSYIVPHEEATIKTTHSRIKILFFTLIFLVSALTSQANYTRVKVLLNKCYKTFLHYAWSVY